MPQSQSDTAKKPVTAGLRAKYAVPSVEKAFAVIELFASHNRGYTLSEVSRILKLPISTTSSLLYTMQNCGYLQRGDKGQFYLSMKIVIQADRVAGQLRPREIAQPELVKLTGATGLTSVLAVLDGDKLAWIEKIDGAGHIQLAAQVGKRMYMHHTSTGKAILAHLPDEKVEAIIKSAGLPPATKNTITSAPVLMKELARVRAQGYAIDDQETGIGMRGIAAPVFDHNAKLVGSVGVGGPVFEMDGNLKSLIASVKECAREVSAKLGYHESTVMETYQSA